MIAGSVGILRIAHTFILSRITAAVKSGGEAKEYVSVPGVCIGAGRNVVNFLGEARFVGRMTRVVESRGEQS
jgi:hypothetical protein